MMKKLLVLTLVLGLAAAANATIQLSLDGAPAPDVISIVPCTYIVIDITSTTADPYGAYIGFDQAGGEWKNLGGGTPWRLHHDPGGESGGGATVVDQTSIGYPNWWLATAIGTPTQLPLVTPGEHFQFDYHCLALGDVTIILQNFDGIEQDRMLIHQIPEPVSMVLLGLGGLFLRRRK